MTPSDPRELIQGYFEGTLTPEEQKRFNSWLRSHPRNLDVFLDQVDAHDALIEAEASGEATRRLPILRWFTRLRPASWAALLMFSVVTAALMVWLLASDRKDPHLVAGKVKVDGVPAGRVAEDKAIEVLGDKAAEFTLGDGSEALIFPGSSFVLRGAEADARELLELRSGGGEFRVKTGKGQFRVETPMGKVTALGTVFRVELRPNPKPSKNAEKTLLAVHVTSGRVRIEYRSATFTLRAGQKELVLGKDQEDGEPEGGPSSKSARPARSSVQGTVVAREASGFTLRITRVLRNPDVKLVVGQTIRVTGGSEMEAPKRNHLNSLREGQAVTVELQTQADGGYFLIGFGEGGVGGAQPKSKGDDAGPDGKEK
jgi:ferric-dicitrate binding protein FerR (iron transport regulator)